MGYDCKPTITTVKAESLFNLTRRRNKMHLTDQTAIGPNAVFKKCEQMDSPLIGEALEHKDIPLKLSDKLIPFNLRCSHGSGYF